jgi:hypothetical protein
VRNTKAAAQLLPKIKLLWTVCPGPKRKGAVSFLSSMRPTSFASYKEARSANKRYRACHGFGEAVIFCEKCSAWHLRHIFSGDLQAGLPHQ